VHFQLTFRQIDDPVSPQPGPGVSRAFDVAVQRAVGYLDDYSNIGRTRMVVEVVELRTAYDGHVWLRLAAGRLDRRLSAAKPSGRQLRRQQFVDEPSDDGVVGWVARHLENDPPFEQFDRILVGQDAGTDHPLVLVYCEAAQWQ